MINKSWKKLLSVLLSAAMLLSLLPSFSLTASALDPVSYLDWNGTELVEKTGADACTSYTTVTASATEWGVDYTDTWYVVNSTVVINSQITIHGTVNLILCDGASLTVSTDSQYGIYRNTNKKDNITVYAQSKGATAGALNITADMSAIYAGRVTINGGNIALTGTNEYGITANPGVVVNGGVVETIGKNGGIFLGSDSSMTVNGGSVTAGATGNVTSGIDRYGTSPFVTISGGELTAYGSDAAIKCTVINAVTGTGWTDVAGTSGETEIAVSTTGQNLSAYKKVQFLAPAPAPAASAVTFTKVTDASQIIAENIGTCTADDAKAWALANWDVAHSDDSNSYLAFYTSGGTLNYVLVYSNMDENSFSSNVEVYSGVLISDLQNCVSYYDENVCICTPSPAAAADTFTKVTDGDQIAADKIGESTFDEAKAWIYDNWDAVTNGVDPAMYIDVVYIVNGSARNIAFFTGECTDKDVFEALVQSDFDADLASIKDYYNTGSDVVYVCSKAAAAAADTFTKVTDGDQLAADSIGECTFDEAKAWVYDNWDAVTNGVDIDIVIVYIVNGSARYVGFTTNECTDKDVFNALVQSDYDADLNDIKDFYNAGFLVAYVCSKAAAPAVVPIELVFTLDNSLYIAEDYTEDGGIWIMTVIGTSGAVENYTVNLKSNNTSAYFTGHHSWSEMDASGCNITTDTTEALVDGEFDITGSDRKFVLTGLFTGASGNVYSVTVASSNVVELTFTSDNDDVWVNDYISAFGYWFIGAESSDYRAVISVNCTTSAPGEYAWSDIQRGEVTVEYRDIAFVDGYCTITENNGVINVAGRFVGEDAGLYAVDITYGSAPAHVHSFTYAAGTGDNAKTVTATCTADGCTDPAYSVAMSIVAPALTVYGGAESAAATLDGAADFNTATGLSVSADSIGYYKAVDNSGVYSRGEALAAAPTGAGTYWAEITVDNAAAYVVYTIAKADPIATAPTGVEATYGDLLSGVTLTNAAGNTAGTWSWEDDPTTVVGDVGNNVFKAKFTPDDTDNYNVVEHVDVSITVGAANSTAASVAANEWTFDGTTKPLLTVTGEAAGGTMKYALGTATQPGTFGDTIPEASAADTYYVWYMVAGDANHNDTDAVPVTVTVARADSTAATVTANGWTFDGTSHALLTVTGEAAGGAMKYAPGTATQPGTFGDTIPEATDPDTYYVWYMVAGDANHNDTDAVLVTVTVAHDEELDAVIAAIDAIGPVTEVLADQKAKIDAARAGYEDLTPAQKQLVTNYATLTDAEADYDALFVFDPNTQITISGVEKLGETLTATATDIPAFITDAVVRWYNDNNELLGTGETYTLTAAEIGKSVRAELYSAEATDSVWSDFTGLVGKGVIKNYTLPTAAHIMYPQTLAEATLTGGETGGVEGVWAWVTPDAQPTSAQSGSAFELTFTPAGTYADLYEGFTTRLAVVVDPAPFEPQSIEDTASGLTFDAEFAQNVEIELTDIAYSQSAYLALLRASKKDDSGMTRLVLLKTIVFTVDGEEADEAYNGAVTVTSYVGAKLAGQTVSVWFFIDGAPVNYVGTVGYDGVLVIDNVAL